MALKSVLRLLVVSLWAIPSMAQTPLAKAFSDMKSSDQATAKTAKERLMVIMEAEIPTIESDTAMLCSALSDQDPYIRLQATAILQAVIVAAPSHAAVATSCSKQLTVTASDKVDRVRNNSLFILAMNPLGASPEAHDTFVTSLGSSNLRTAQLAAAGLLREHGQISEANQGVVEQALRAAPDDRIRLNLLYAIAGSAVPSELLFGAVQKYLFDPNSEVQQAAIDAASVTSVDDSKLLGAMHGITSSTTANPVAKQRARAVLARLEPTP